MFTLLTVGAIKILYHGINKNSKINYSTIIPLKPIAVEKVSLHNLEGDIHQVTHQDAELSTVSKQILAFCTTPKSKKELAAFYGFKDLRNFTLKHINPLLESGQSERMIPDKPKSKKQKYITVHFE